MGQSFAPLLRPKGRELFSTRFPTDEVYALVAKDQAMIGISLENRPRFLRVTSCLIQRLTFENH